MTNGTFVLIRVLACTLIALVGLGGAIVLLSRGIEPLTAYWVLLTIAVLGVAGEGAAKLYGELFGKKGD